MSSSDEEDCYGNIAIKLQSLKNNYRPDKPSQPLERATSIDSGVPSSLRTANTSRSDDSIINLLEDVPSVPDLPPVTIANPSPAKKRKITRKSSRLSCAETVPNSAQVPVTTSRRGRKRKSAAAVVPVNVPELVQPPSNVAPPLVSPTPVMASSTPIRGGRGRGARGGTRARGRQRGRGRRSMAHQLLEHMMMSSIIYSVGNTDEYPDTAENVPIFSKSNEADVKVTESIDLSSSFSEDLENEEMSVKVCWQQTEYVKFNIRRFQKLSQIFDFFSKRESVSPDKLLFTLRSRILRPDDTPDSVDYNIVMFIDGGIVNSSIAGISGSTNKENNTTTGIKIKFQCQNSKKPFETHIEPSQKLSTAMLKCAEHFELPYGKLRFILDGDSISPTSTPSDHGLDNGDCIDVKLTS